MPKQHSTAHARAYTGETSSDNSSSSSPHGGCCFSWADVLTSTSITVRWSTYVPKDRNSRTSFPRPAFPAFPAAEVALVSAGPRGEARRLGAGFARPSKPPSWFARASAQWTKKVSQHSTTASGGRYVKKRQRNHDTERKDTSAEAFSSCVATHGISLATRSVKTVISTRRPRRRGV